MYVYMQQKLQSLCADEALRWQLVFPEGSEAQQLLVMKSNREQYLWLQDHLISGDLSLHALKTDIAFVGDTTC